MRAEGVSVVLIAAFVAACSQSEAPAGLESWAISAAPSTSIGVVDGDSTYLFQRIVDVAFGPDGQILVADGGLLLVREYDPAGRFASQLGGRGEGPGEFQSVRGIWIVPPDTIGVWDSRALRLTYFGRGGAAARTVSLESANASAGAGRLDFLAGSLSDGSVVIGSVALAEDLGGDLVSLERISPSGDHLGQLAETRGLVRARLADQLTGPVPFSPFPHVTTHADVMYYTNGMEPRVITWSPVGGDTITFPAHEYDVDREWSNLAAEVERRSVEPFVRAVGTAPRPQLIPHLAGLLVDDAGFVWAKRYEPLADAIWLVRGLRSSGGTWWVSDPSGDLVATVAIPEGFAPVEIRGAQVLGVVTDSLGVERVEVRTLVK